MKIVITGDWHLDAVTLGQSRFDDLKLSLDKLWLLTVREKPDAFIFLGDLCNPDRGARTLRAIHMAAFYGRALGELQIPSYWIAGNHDVVDSTEVITSLTPISQMAFLTVVERPLSLKLGNWQFIFLPYVTRLLQHDVDLASFVDTECKAATEKKRRVLIAGHCTHVPDALMGDETTALQRGRSQVFPVEVGRRYGAVMFNGHYHTKQRTPGGVYMPGALGRFDFGEADNLPHFFIFDSMKGGK